MTVAGGALAGSGQAAFASIPLAEAAVASRALSAPAPAAAPAPDVLDVTFDAGAPADAAQSLAPITYGAPTYGTDPEQGPTMTVDGVDDAVGFGFEDQWSKLGTGLSVECVFRIDTATITSGEKNLCSDKEAGGIAMFVNGGNLGFMAHVGGGYKTATAPIEGERWYHAAAVWDGVEIKLYVNGQLAATTAASGTLTIPTASSRRFVVGADAGPGDIGQVAPPSTFANAAVHSRALSTEEVIAAAAEWKTAIAVPAADVLDVDFADGTPAERVKDLGVKKFGDPEIVDDKALRRPVVDLDGDDAFGYDLTPHWGEITDQVSIECTFRYTGTFPAPSEVDVCSGKEAGGYSIYVTGDEVGMMAHIGGGYKNVRAPFTPNVWHHVVGTWDGAEMKLYVDGVLATTIPATGALTLPSATARAWTVGADSGPNAGAQFYTQGRIAAARLYSQALAAEEVKALDIAAFGEYPNAEVAVTSTVPAAGQLISTPVELEVEVVNKDNASGWTYLVDGEPVNPGDLVGPGLAAGQHTLTISAVDVFGKDIESTVTFESEAIPTGDGTDAGQGKGSVSLSAIATSPDGSDVTTTFRSATATVAEGGTQGVVGAVPTELDFTFTEEEAISGKATPEDEQSLQSPSSGDIPFQRFDVEVGAAVTGQQVVWKGTVDPERSVTLMAWNATTSAWVQIAEGRGAREGDTTLNGVVKPALVDDGVVHLLVLGTDPFADDLSPRDASAAEDEAHFEDPADYDFSLAHFTDTQYLAEGAAGGTYDDWDGNAEASDVMKEAERELWARSYDSTTEWLAEQAEARKISYVAHTGDITENNYYDPLATNSTGGLLYPGLDEQVTREFEFTANSHELLERPGIVNQVVAGNHDNQLGNETGPASRFNRFFGPQRYYDLAQNWPAGSSYHAWDETTDAEGNLVTPGEDNQNNYVLFSAGGLDFVAVGLSYGVTQEEADWASEVFARFPDRNGILLTHAYIAPSSAADGRGANFSGDGSKLYDEVVAANPNVFLILAGHEHGVGTNLKTGVGAQVQHNVVELLADYQFYKVSAGELWPDKVDSSGNIDLDGDGVTDRRASDLLQLGASWLRMLQFDVDRAEVSIDTYSPLFDDFGAGEYDDRKRYNGAEDNLVLPVDLSSRTTTFSTDGLTVVTPTDTVIGEQTAKSGWPATVEWSGLAEGEIYAWTAQSRSASGERVGAINQFGTVFRATSAGTDATAPTIEVPSSTEVTVGEAFDPMAGVSATDNRDGDVTDQVQVIGLVDVERPGSYGLTYVVADANGNQVVAPRVVTVVEPVDDRSATSVSIANRTATFGSAVTLTASLRGVTAGGQVRFMNGEEVLCEAPVVGGRAECDVKTLPPPGAYVIVASFGGDETHQPAERSFVLTVQQPAKPGAPSKADPKLKAKAKKASVPRGRSVVLKATVARGVTGKVVFKSGGKKLCVATINAKGVAKCKVPATLKAGTYTIKAKYRGSSAHTSDVATFTFVKRR